jgi:hypothetical protein
MPLRFFKKKHTYTFFFISFALFLKKKKRIQLQKVPSSIVLSGGLQAYPSSPDPANPLGGLQAWLTTRRRRPRCRMPREDGCRRQQPLQNVPQARLRHSRW